MAVVTDAGMPACLIRGPSSCAACVAVGVPVTAVPRPTAVDTALALSGIPAQEFHFFSFLPNKSGPRREKLSSAAELSGALVFYEAPHRLLESLADMQAVLGDRPAACTPGADQEV